MAFDAFLQLTPEIPGEATAKGFEGSIELLSFSLGASQTVNMTGGGLSAGKAQVSDFNIMKKTDISSPSLFAKLCDGTHFDTGKVSFRKAGGEQVIYLTYDFEEVFVTSVQWSGSTGGDDVPTESASFAFKKIQINYFPQDKKGQAKGPQKALFDLALVSSK